MILHVKRELRMPVRRTNSSGPSQREARGDGNASLVHRNGPPRRERHRMHLQAGKDRLSEHLARVRRLESPTRRQR